MILMSPGLDPGRTRKERADFLRKVEAMAVRTISMSVPADWKDREVEEARGFLDDHRIGVGEYSAFHIGFDSADASEREAGMEHYRRQLRHGRTMGAHCVGFSTYAGRGTAGMWSNETWRRCVDVVAELAEEAERVGMDIAAHPHVMSPLCSVERYLELIDEVDSPRLKILMDVVNLTWPQMVFRTTELVEEVFEKLGERITALHAKDVIISGGSGVPAAKGLGVIHLDEAVPGTGHMDYTTTLRRLDALDHDVTVHVEHFSYEDTVEGQRYIRRVAREVGVEIA